MDVRRKIVIAFLLATSFPLQAVADVFTEYLTGKEIWAIAYDAKRGMVWFGTDNSGLISFDGNKFIEYNPSNSKLRDSFVRALTFDHNGRLWVGTDSRGASRFTPEKNLWEPFDATNGLLNNRVNSITVDRRGRVWFGTNAGVGMYDEMKWYSYTREEYAVWDGKQWISQKRYTENEKRLPFNVVNVVAADSSGKIWCGTMLGVSALLEDRLTWNNFLNGLWVLSILVDRNNHKWFGMNEADVTTIYQLTDGKNPAPVNQPRLANQNIYAIIQDYDSNLWFGLDTGIGAVKLDPSNMVWRYKTGFTKLDAKQIQSLAADEDGNIWFGSTSHDNAAQYTANWVTFSIDLDEGLGRLDLLNGRSRGANRIFATSRDQSGQIWIGTGSGVARFTKGMWIPKNLFPGVSGSHPNVLAFIVNPDTTLWVGTYGRGVVKITREAVKIDSLVKASDPAKGLISNHVLSLALAGDTLWIGTQEGLSRYNHKTKLWGPSFTTANSTLPSNEVYALAFDLQGGLWCGTPNGASRYFNGKWEKSLTIRDGLVNNAINTIRVDSLRGDIWFGTDGGGVSILSRGQWSKITTDDDLADNFVNDIKFIYDRGEVWFATGGGASCRNAAGEWTTYKTIDGLADNNVTTIQTGATSGEIWFGTSVDGVTRYRRQPKRPDTVILTQLEITTQPEVGFEFIGKDLNTSKDLLRYSYKLDNDRWSEPGFGPSARLKLTTAGLHTFFVKAIDKDKNEDLSPASKTFYKLEPGRGSSTSFTYKEGICGFDSLKLTFYWPPQQLSDTSKITITPLFLPRAETCNFTYGFHLSAEDTNAISYQRPVTLTFTFPLNDSIKAKKWAIYYQQNYFGGASQTSTVTRQNYLPSDSAWSIVEALAGRPVLEATGKMMNVSTAIHRFGRYALREIPETLALRVADATEFNFDAQPRVFSPFGRSHGLQTTLSFKLAASAPVQIKVYNLAGRLVRTVWNEPMNAGVNAVGWDGRDYNQRVCPTGLYIIMIESNGRREHKKVMILNE